MEELHDRGSIEPRSRRDRAVIVARSSRDWGAYVVESPPFERRSIDEFYPKITKYISINYIFFLVSKYIIFVIF